MSFKSLNMFLSFQTSYMAGNGVYITPNQNVVVGNRTKNFFNMSDGSMSTSIWCTPTC